jgi:Tol biopolymer transport system component
VSENRSVDALLLQGIKEARDGNNAEARALFEQVLQADNQNERAWYFLSRVVDSEDEKRVCLENVLLLNPENEDAQRDLARLDSGDLPGRISEEKGGEGGTGFVVLIAALVIVALIVVGGVVVLVSMNNPPTPTPLPTTEVTPSTTPSATYTPTPTFTFTPSATFTPSRTPYQTPEIVAFPPVGGHIWGGSGTMTGQGYMPISRFMMDGSEEPATFRMPQNPAQEIMGMHPAVSPTGGRVVFALASLSLNTTTLWMMNTDGTDLQQLTTGWDGPGDLLNQQSPDWSPDGSQIAFSAEVDGKNDIYLMAASPGAAIRRVTDDDAQNTWPAWGTAGEIVYVAEYERPVEPTATPTPNPDATETPTPEGTPTPTGIPTSTPVGDAESGPPMETVTELRVISAEGGEPRNLTDNGSAIIENAPDWSPNGRTIVFEGWSPDMPGDSTLYTIPYSGGEPEPFIEMLGKLTVPRWSPDGRYVLPILRARFIRFRPTR